MPWGNTTLDAREGYMYLMGRLDEPSGYRMVNIGLVASNQAGFSVVAYPRSFKPVNGVTTSEGKVEPLCAQFTASSTQYLSNLGVSVTPSQTIVACSAWIYPDSIPGSDMNICFESVAGSNNSLFVLSIVASTGELTVGMRDNVAGSLLSATSTNQFSTGQWYHVLAVIDTDADYIYAWVNGTEWINSNVSMGAFATTTPQTCFRIGNSGDLASPFDGRIEQVVVWRGVSMTIGDAQALYNSGSGRRWNWNTIPSGVPGRREILAPTVLKVPTTWSSSDLQAAIDGLPRYISANSYLVIQFEEGTHSYGDVTIYIDGFYGWGRIYIQGNSTEELAAHTTQEVFLDSTSTTSLLRIQSCRCPVYVLALKIRTNTSSGYSSPVFVYDSLISCQFCYLLGTSKSYAYAVGGYHGRISLYGNTYDNIRSGAFAGYGTRMYASGNTTAGSGVTYMRSCQQGGWFKYYNEAGSNEQGTGGYFWIT